MRSGSPASKDGSHPSEQSSLGTPVLPPQRTSSLGTPVLAGDPTTAHEWDTRARPSKLGRGTRDGGRC